MKRATLMLAAIALLPTTAFAYIDTYGFTATVNGVNDPQNIFAGSIYNNQIISGTYTFNTLATPSNSSPVFASYPVIKGSLQMGNQSFTSNSTSSYIGVFNDAGSPFFYDAYSVTVYSNSAIIREWDFTMSDLSAMVFSDTSLPLSPPNFNQALGVYRYFASDNITVLASVSFVVASITVVPEPDTLTLLGIGITSMAGYAWWRRRKPAAA
jgi:hypothetical protein